MEILLMKSSQIHEAILAKFDIRTTQDNLPLVGMTGTRNELAELFGELGYKRGAEIGVREGIYSEILCRVNPGLELFCVDPWEPTSTYTPRKVRRLEQETRDRVAPYNATLVKKYSLDAVKDIPNRSLDFVYIDALHDYDSVIMDIIHWIPKVRRGGIISGHDFCYFRNGGVVFAVEGYTRAHDIRPWYLTSQDKEPSWFWVV
jgi:hypothetical protein